MKDITLHQPSKTSIGSSSIKRMTVDFTVLGCKRLLVICDPFVSDRVAEKFWEILPERLEIKIFPVSAGEPTFGGFELLLSVARAYNADSVVGIGGGSTLDVAKLVAALLYADLPALQYVGNGLLEKRVVPLGCMPTTSGAGSEASPNAILIDESNGSKKGIISPNLVPDFVYIDPDFLVSIPPMITAYTGIDALTHCIEAYVNRFAHPIIDVFALEGIRLIGRNLKKAFDNGQDIEARSKVAIGSFYGGMCLGPVNTAAVHALAYPLGTKFKIPHGLSNALLLPFVMEYNLSSAKERYATVALALGAEKGNNDHSTAMNGIYAIRKMISDFRLPARLSDIDIPDSAIEGMATSAMEIQRLLKNNVREITLSDAIHIYKSAY
jgi:alcohol dehydrogenase